MINPQYKSLTSTLIHLRCSLNSILSMNTDICIKIKILKTKQIYSTLVNFLLALKVQYKNSLYFFITT